MRNKMKEHEHTDRELSMLALITGSADALSNVVRSTAQHNLTKISQLPKPEKQVEEIGIKIIDPVENDSLFYNVEFPEGWTRKRTDHGMYTDILDEHGRKRATIMYKPDPWDRAGYTRVVDRFTASYTNDSWEDPTANKHTIPAIINSNNEIVWRGKPLTKKDGWHKGKCPYPQTDGFRNKSDEYYYSSSDHARHIATKILFAICPEYKNNDKRHLLYWDIEPQWPESLSQKPDGELYSVYVELFNYVNGSYNHVDSGLNCKIRATKHDDALEKAVQATKSLQSYDRLAVRVMLDGHETGSRVFEKPISHMRRTYRRDFCDFYGYDG